MVLQESIGVRKRMIKDKQNAFTVIELMTVVALVAIVAVLAVPSMRNMILENRLVSFANDFVSTVSIARTEAISNRERVQITSNDDDWSNGWKIVIDSNGNNDFTDDDDEVLREFNIANGLSLKGTPANMTINSNGIVDGLTWSGITICDTREKGRTVNVGGAGITSVDKTPDCS